MNKRMNELLNKKLTYVLKGTSYDTVEKLVEALRAGRTDAILLDMYVQMKRKDLFNQTSTWYAVSEIIDKKLAHGIELRGVSATLAKEIENYIQEKNIETKYLEDKSHEDEDEEEHSSHSVREFKTSSLNGQI